VRARGTLSRVVPEANPVALGRLLIVEDQPADRAAFVRICKAQGIFEDLETADSGAAALAAIRESQPDVVLINCELSDMTGFDVLRELSSDERPPSILVAQDERYAIQAIESAAVDYLTKPVNAARFEVAVGRARERVASRMAGALRQDIMAAVRGASFRSDTASPLFRRLVGEKAHRLHFLPIETVDFIESDGNYVTIHVGDQKYTSRDSVKRLAGDLKHLGFERIRRDTLINLGRVAFAERLGQAALAFTLCSGTRLVSRSGYRLRLAASLRGAPAGHTPNAQRELL
jgi:two-component system, LytTR family, response regulator